MNFYFWVGVIVWCVVALTMMVLIFGSCRSRDRRGRGSQRSKISGREVPPAPSEIRLVSQWLGYRSEYDPRRGWVVVPPFGRKSYTLEDVKELLK